MSSNKRGKFYLALVIFSLIGQIAWVVENMYFNVFIYKMFGAMPSDIALMVSASAISATLTTILIGALSDKLGKRKVFICGGYILWGLSILSFAFIREDIIGKIFPAVSASAICITLVIVMDCVMTFFGSSANDACFNAWLTDVTTEKDRGRAEGINSMMPLVAILCVFGGFMSLDQSKSQSWTIIFVVIGVFVTIIGVLGIFLINEPKIETSENQAYFKNILYGFRPSVIKQSPRLYLLLVAFAIFGISIQIFMPYLIIYYEKTLQMSDYVFIMAPAIILASVFTALWGKAYDKFGFNRSATVSLALLGVGYLVLVLSREKALVFIGSLLMMCGYLSGMAVFGASIRDNTPKNRSGMFQGLRIVAQVLIPGVVGPMIGEAILAKDAVLVENSDGTTSFLPNEGIFVGALVVLFVLAVFLVISLMLFSRLKKPTLRTLYTEQGQSLDSHAWDEYPRPQLKRESYVCLNGEWTLLYGDKSEKILVPFPPESVLSGIGHSVGEDFEYKRALSLATEQGKRALLHFGAIDQEAKIYINDTLVCENNDTYLPITVDITGHLTGKEDTLRVVVHDSTSTTYPYGKQKIKRGGMWYTPISGIWQSVWLEVVPEQYVKSLKIDTTQNSVKICAEGISDGKITLDNGKEYEMRDGVCEFTIESPIEWSPESPHLYHFTLKAGEDEVKSYFALRTLDIREVDGVARLCLNGKPYFFHGLLDQGYFSDGIYTPASPTCLENDVLQMKALGFNTLRKHIKIEHELFYYYCDLHGMVVFQDMVNNSEYSFIRDTALPTIGMRKRNDTRGNAQHKEVFERHMRGVVDTLYNHPCICYWTIFNEGWGQSHSQKMYELLKSLDTSRFIDTASGWFKGADSDVESEHIYFKRVKLKPSERPIVLSEFGGYSCKIENHSFNLDKTYGYRFFERQEDFENALERLYLDEIAPLIKNGLCGAIYTQLSDVEDETNGLVTYDRRATKVTPERMLAIAEVLKI